MKLALLKLLLDRLDVPHYLPDEADLTDRQRTMIDALVRCELYKWPISDERACAQAEYERERYRLIGAGWERPSVRRAARDRRAQGCVGPAPATLEDALERWVEESR